MKPPRTELCRWLAVVIYAVAMAWMESAVVFYLRKLTGQTNPIQGYPLSDLQDAATAEIIREAATLVMLLAVGWLAGRNWHTRLGYTLVAFGIWDIFYYVFLVPLTGWPRSLLDWDILFLIPLPWWGPVLAPVSIALLMVLWGTLVTQFATDAEPLRSSGKIWALNFLGIGVALYVFMADALHVAGQGLEAIQKARPTSFHWPLFMVALLLIAVPAMDAARQLRRHRSLRLSQPQTT